MDPTIKDFESASAELEAIVKKLEDGDLTLEKALELYERGVQLSRFCHAKLEEGDLALEQSLALYERGVQLSRFCHARLEDAERRIEILTDRGDLKPAPASLGADDPDR